MPILECSFGAAPGRITSEPNITYRSVEVPPVGASEEDCANPIAGGMRHARINARAQLDRLSVPVAIYVLRCSAKNGAFGQCGLAKATRNLERRAGGRGRDQINNYSRQAGRNAGGGAGLPENI